MNRLRGLTGNTTECLLGELDENENDINAKTRHQTTNQDRYLCRNKSAKLFSETVTSLFNNSSKIST